jgi:hypothetical protein
MSDPLKRLARRVEADPHFLASLLAEYARAEGLDDIGLARELNCRAEDLTGVRLCRAPRPDTAGCREDVRRVADRFGLAADRLLEIVRQVEALRRLRDGGAAAPEFLMAARDRPDAPPCPEEGKRP